jgi:hypothetical protein
VKPAKMTREFVAVEDAPFELLGEEGTGEEETGEEGVSVDNEVGVIVLKRIVSRVQPSINTVDTYSWVPVTLVFIVESELDPDLDV